MTRVKVNSDALCKTALTVFCIQHTYEEKVLA